MPQADCYEEATETPCKHFHDEASPGADRSTNECPDLPVALWQCVYRHTNTQRDICNGMRVCKTLRSALPELLVGATLRATASLVCLPAIQASFVNLILLEVLMHRPDDVRQPLGNTDLASLSFPHLRKLRLTNNVADRLVFDQIHYPQLRQLVVERTANTGFSVNDLTLQLPHLLTLKLEGVFVESLGVLAACLSAAACPRLRRFSAISINFGMEGIGPQEMLIDAPWLEYFEVQQLDVTSLQLRAPRLTALQLINCYELNSVVLLPDGLSLIEDIAANAADVAVAVPDSTCEEDVQTAIRMREAMASLGLHASGPPPVAAPRAACSAKRIDLTICNLEEWQSTDGYETLVSDPRIRSVEDQGYEDQGEGSEDSDGNDPMWKYLNQDGRSDDYVFGGDDYAYDDRDDYGDA